MIIHIWILWIVMSPICLLSHFASGFFEKTIRPSHDGVDGPPARTGLSWKRWWFGGFYCLETSFPNEKTTKKYDKLENILEWSFLCCWNMVYAREKVGFCNLLLLSSTLTLWASRLGCWGRITCWNFPFPRSSRWKKGEKYDEQNQLVI